MNDKNINLTTSHLSTFLFVLFIITEIYYNYFSGKEEPINIPNTYFGEH